MHKHFLLKALELARLGKGACFPNPSVGAIAVRNNTIIAHAWHHGAGTPHAEQLLLTQFSKNTPGVTLYVTLEPCNHWGKTPPCVDVIIEHGVEKVVYAYKDPNPIVANNNTPELLKANGISVVYYNVPEITEFYQSYNYWIKNKKPWISAKIAQTFDGKIAPSSGEKLILSNAVCSEFTHKQRLYTDIIITTARTINIDNPQLNARIDGSCYAKHLAVIDAKLELRQDAEVFKTAKICHIYYDAALKAPPDRDNCKYHGYLVENGHFDLEKVICHLGSMGYHDAWVEAGGNLFSSLHKSRLVNKTYIYLVPKLLGNESVTAYESADLFDSSFTIKWQTMEDNMLAIIDWNV